MMATVERALGPVDVLVNNAASAWCAASTISAEADFDLTIAVNLKSVFLCTQAVIPACGAQMGPHRQHLIGAARGAGGVGRTTTRRRPGMEGMTAATRAAGEGRHHGERVAPSLIETDMVKQGLASAASRIPLGRFGTPAECAQIVMMLVGNAYMTGQTVALSGGMSFL
jgi:3-oxoacyl-[acyl-carrier protein] reductase